MIYIYKSVRKKNVKIEYNHICEYNRKVIISNVYKDRLIYLDFLLINK